MLSALKYREDQTLREFMADLKKGGLSTKELDELVASEREGRSATFSRAMKEGRLPAVCVGRLEDVMG